MTRLNSPKILDDMFFEACCDFFRPGEDTFLGKGPDTKLSETHSRRTHAKESPRSL